MIDSVSDHLKFIGLCLAPLDEGRRGMLAELARGIGNWSETYELARMRYVLPLVHFRLSECGLQSEVPEEVYAEGKKLYERVAALNSLHLRDIVPLTADLGRKGSPVMYLKGSALVISGAYPNPGLRMMSDVDLAARPEHQPEVRKTFNSDIGWWRRLDKRSEREEDVYMRDDGAIIEVHHDFSPLDEVDRDELMERLWRNAEEADYLGEKVFVTSPGDSLVQGLVHIMDRHVFNTALFFVLTADVCHLVGNMEIDLADVIERLGEERMIELAHVALEVCARLAEYQPLNAFLAEFNDRAPGIAKKNAALVDSFYPMVLKPWVTYGGGQAELFSEPTFTGMARVLLSGLKRRVKKPEGPEVYPDDNEWKPTYEKNFLDLDMLRFMYRLFRFYRRIGYRSPMDRMLDDKEGE